MSTRRPRWASATTGLVGIVGLGLVLAGCTGDAAPVAEAGSAPPRPATTAAPGTTRPRWTPEQQEVVDAYLAAVDAQLRASSAGDPELTALADTHGEPLLGQLKTILQSRKQANQRARVPADSENRTDIDGVEVVDQQTALITSCVVDDTVVYEQTSGSVVDDQLVAVRMEVTMRREVDAWKETARRVVSTSRGVSQCAE